MAGSKKRVIKSLETLNEELKELLRRQYPNGYESSITRISNAKNEPIFVFPLETEEAIYLIKLPVTKNSEGGYDVESGVKEEFDNAGGGDDFENSNEDDFEAGSDEPDSYGEDEGGGSKRGREASYDPDFDD